MRLAVIYEREMLKNVMERVKEILTDKVINRAWVHKASTGQYEFHLNTTPRFPNGLYWCGHAASKYGGRALGWEFVLREVERQEANLPLASDKPDLEDEQDKE